MSLPRETLVLPEVFWSYFGFLYNRITALEDDVSDLIVKDEAWSEKFDRAERKAELRYIRNHTESKKLLDFYITTKATLNIAFRTALANNTAALPSAGIGERIGRDVTGSLQILSLIAGFSPVPLLATSLASSGALGSHILDHIENTHADRLKAFIPDADPTTQSIIVDKLARTLTIGLEERIINGLNPDLYIRPEGPIGAAVGSFLDNLKTYWGQLKAYIYPRDDSDHTSVYGQLGSAYASALVQLFMADVEHFKADDFKLYSIKDFSLKNFDQILKAFTDVDFDVNYYRRMKANKIHYTPTINIAAPSQPSAATHGAGAIPPTSVLAPPAPESHLAYLRKTVPFAEAVRIIKEIADKQPTHRGLKADPWFSCCDITIAKTLQGARTSRPPMVPGYEMQKAMEALYLSTKDCIDELRNALKDKTTTTNTQYSYILYDCGAAKDCICLLIR